VRSVAAGVVALVAVLSTCALATSTAHAERGSSGACGSFTEAGAYNGAENKRVAVVNRRVPCGAAITIVREFRSFLGKRHHGPAGDAGWWTLPADPGWQCHRQGEGGFCARGGGRADYGVKALSDSAGCRNSIAIGVGGVAFLSWRQVGCGLRKRIGRSLAGGHRGRRPRGFRCRPLALRAGGGGELCRKGSRFVEVGFE
jgi:hypothetical protein